jgi:hypothetical protein
MSAFAVAALVASACTPQSRAVFDELVLASGAAAPPAAEAPPDTGEASPPADAAGTWFSHRDGYAMQVPAGWAAVRLGASDLQRLLEAVAGTHPAASTDVQAALAEDGVKVSSIALQTASVDAVAPLVAVLSRSTDGLRPGQVASRVMDSIAALPGLAGEITRSTDHLPAGESARFLFRIQHGELGGIAVRGNLFRFGGAAYLVVLAAPDPSFADAEASFVLMLETLRFGV